jgi:hypothetical protein
MPATHLKGAEGTTWTLLEAQYKRTRLAWFKIECRFAENSQPSAHTQYKVRNASDRAAQP